MITSPTSRVATLCSYLGMSPAGALYLEVKRELLAYIPTVNLEKEALFSIFKTGISEVIGAALEQTAIIDLGINDPSPLSLFRPSPEGIEDTKRSLTLLAPHMCDSAPANFRILFSIAHGLDDPDLLDWIDENITDLDIPETLPQLLGSDMKTCRWGPSVPRMSKWIEAQLARASFDTPTGEDFLWEVVESDDLRMHLALFRINAERLKHGIASIDSSSQQALDLLRVASSNHARLKLLTRLPEDLLVLYPYEAGALVEACDP